MLMAKIHFYDVTKNEAEPLKDLATKQLAEHDVSFDGDELTVQNADAEAEVVTIFVSSHVGAEELAKMPKLRLLVCRSTGYDNIDLDAAKARNVVVTNVPTYGENTVAEYAFGLILMLSRKLPQAIEALHEGQTSHDALQGWDLLGKTLGVVGAGRIGCHLAQIGRGFGMEVLAFDERPDPKRSQQYGFTYAALEDVLARADVVSLHVPGLPSTTHMINRERLAKMKTTAILINTCRGEVVDTSALIEALQAGRPAGAALDVFEAEPLVGIDEELRLLRAQKVDQLAAEESLEFDVLKKMPNVIMTNHNAFNTVEAVARINTTSVDNIVKFLAGTPQNQVG